jgi:hypothetical protein
VCAHGRIAEFPHHPERPEHRLNNFARLARRLQLPLGENTATAGDQGDRTTRTPVSTRRFHMRRITLVSSLLAGLAIFAARPSQAAVSLDFNIHVGDYAPVAYFHQQPQAYLVPSSSVSWYDNAGYDCYRYGNAYYVNDGGYWYTSHSWRGPFVGVRYASVPVQVLQVPTRYRHQPRGYWQSAQRPTWGSDSRWRNDNRWSNDSRSNDRNQRGGQEQNWRNDRNDGDDHRWSSRDDDQDNGNKGKGHGKGHDKNKGNKGRGNGKG